jgi:hypothetical protein
MLRLTDVSELILVLSTLFDSAIAILPRKSKNYTLYDLIKAEDSQILTDTPT